MVTGHLAARVQGGEGAVEEESVQDVHCKEAAILMQRLTEPLRKHNIILSHDNLRLLAIIHESLVSIYLVRSGCVTLVEEFVVSSSMGTHTGSTSHWVADSSMGTL